MKKLNLSEIVQTLANVGVIESIIFLAFEVQQFETQLEAQTRYNFHQGQQEMLILYATDPFLGNIGDKLANKEEITSE